MEKETSVLISVIMGVYYQSKDISLLRRAIDSVLSQIYTDFELLICDDGSCDVATKLLDDYEKADDRIRILRSGKLFSLPEKLNYCLRHVRGHFVARMDDDDYCHKERFQQQVSYLMRCNEIDFVGCNVNYTIRSKIIQISRFPSYPKPEDFCFSMPYIHPTLMFRKKALDSVGGYNEAPRYRLCEDYDLLLRLYEKGFQGANLESTLFDYSLDGVEQKRRSLAIRWNECVIRFRHFYRLHMLPSKLPYVIKPIVVGMIPTRCLNVMRKKRMKYLWK